MANNSSSVVGQPFRTINEEVILVQVLIAVFLFINIVLLTTFFMKEVFYTTMRYIFFATTLMSDCLILVLTDVMLLQVFFNFKIPMGLCCILVILSILYTLVTPFTLTAMSLERYVAICMPLRHAELCSPRSTLNCILIIHGLSSLPSIITFAIVFASAPLSFYQQNAICTLNIFIFHRWQNELLAVINEFYFINMCITVIYCYVQIMKVAKTASGEDKKSVWKGIKTVVLHAFQLLLCLIQLWCPFIENAVFKINKKVFVIIRYFNYIVFYLASRCLSPLVYGLRDESFYLALKHYALLGFRGKRCFH
ncbi:odorant receptor 131-2-like [Salarias fasciatus]|uniref:Odorant receptor 131-2-like n=1 Tax=Salarias fasciatus TaxID=181472 RepID=A0A672GR24_SALFA|nr:odorant receptor 131-2-like [Salarias fasciatus]